MKNTSSNENVFVCTNCLNKILIVQKEFFKKRNCPYCGSSLLKENYNDPNTINRIKEKLNSQQYLNNL